MKERTAERRELYVLLSISIFTAVLYFSVSGNYGIFRDELYYFACGEHLDWGYVDHPPMIALVSAVVRTIFGDWLPGLRLPATLAIAATVFLAGWIARRLGAGMFGQFLAASCVVVAPVYQGMSNFLSMNAFDLLFWAVIILLIVEMIKSEDKRIWIWLGLAIGLGLMNKYSVIFLALAFAISIPFSKLRRHLLTPWPYTGAALALVILLPNLLWQAAHGWPFIEFQAQTTERTMAWISLPLFLKSQVMMMHPISVIIWGAGLGALLFWRPVRQYRLFGLMWLVALALYILKGSKVYYPAPTYLMLFPAGAMLLETLFRRKGFRWVGPALLVVLIASSLIVLPYGLPVLPVETFIEYNEMVALEGKPTFEDGRPIMLRQHYADRFGWEEMVQMVAEVYHSLSPEEKEAATIFGANYGNAGAVDFFREKYKLPGAISQHLTYWIWGTGDNTAEILITCGRVGKEDLEQLYEEVREAAWVEHPYAIFYETGYPIMLCKGRKFDFKQLWQQQGMSY